MLEDPYLYDDKLIRQNIEQVSQNSDNTINLEKYMRFINKHNALISKFLSSKASELVVEPIIVDKELFFNGKTWERLQGILSYTDFIQSEEKELK